MLNQGTQDQRTRGGESCIAWIHLDCWALCFVRSRCVVCKGKVDSTSSTLFVDFRKSLNLFFVLIVVEGFARTGEEEQRVRAK